ncbi:GEVED domain-containing protein [Fibrella aquatica]|uniref:GEVED domain-containing protein n=1 Tax=Fibrella aquatica TaxID=3242487 RepID=UPI00351FE910
MRLVYFLSVLFISLTTGYVSQAQQKIPPSALFCGAPELTDGQRRELDQLAKLALAMKMSANAAPTALTYVPIRPHIFRTSAGAGGINLAKLNRIMAVTNSYYLLNGFGIQFYFAGNTPDYIDNDSYYSVFNPDNEDIVVAGRDVPNAMNMYFVDSFSESGLGGYAYFPANLLKTTRSFILNESNEADLGNRLLPHELGHNFNLYHTFQGSTGNVPELVTRGVGANCTTAGDLVCDTPADPYGRAGASTASVNGCQQYNGTATDPQGAQYTPSITNIMSYYFPCTHDFTTGQYDRMAAGLALRQNHTAYSLTYPVTAVTAPANLSVTLSANGRSVALNWQDLATNEMGYFVERSARPTDGFGSVGGTGPDQTSFTDANLPMGGVFYYRIRPSNTTTGSLSQVVVVNVPVCKPTYVSSCAVSNGLASVTLNGTILSTVSGCAVSGYSSLTTISAVAGAGQSIPFSATLLNAGVPLYTAVWVDLNRNGVFEGTELLARTPAAGTGSVTLSLALPVSLTIGSVQVRVLTATTLPTDPCGNYAGGEAEDYLLTIVNPANCAAPTALTVTAVGTTTAVLAWTASTGGPPFAVQYRPTGTSNWSSVSGISGTSLTLSGLSFDRTYEWQVLALCGTAGSSPLSVAGLFVTACSTPIGLTTAPIYSNSAQLNWSGGADNTYSLQWRLVGNPAWTTIALVSSMSYTLAGLTTNAVYEWRVATNCSSGPSAYSPPVSFTANGPLAYCIPGIEEGCADNDGLNGFTLGNFVMSSNSGCSPGAYQSFTTVGATLRAGQSYPFLASLLSTVYQEGLAIWIDLDKNGIFSAGELSYSSPTLQTTSIAGSLALPGNTAPGEYRMRVRVAYIMVPSDPCSTVTYGETEDYVISVCASASATLAGSQTITSGQTATLSVSLAGSGPWSFTIGNGNSFSGITTSPFALTVNPTITTSYSLIQVENSCGVGVSNGEAVITVVQPCEPPASITVVGLSATSASVTWENRDLSTYVVEWQEVGLINWPGSMTVNAPNAQLTGLVPNTDYAVRVWVLCSGGILSEYSQSQSFTTLAAADLALAMVVSNRTPAVNEVVTFTVVVSNAGPQLADGVLVKSLLPPNMTFAGSSLTSIASDGETVYMAVVDALPAGTSTSGTFSFSALVTQPGVYHLAAQIIASSVEDTDSYLNSGTADGDDDAASVDLRTRETGNSLFESPNPTPRVLPTVLGNQPLPEDTEADLSLSLQVNERTPLSGSPINVSVVVANRGVLTATGITATVTLPAGWVVTNTAGLIIEGQVVTLTVANLAAGQVTVVNVPVQVAGSGEQHIQGLITAAGQPDLDSPHTNGHGLGEDDEAVVSVRVR